MMDEESPVLTGIEKNTEVAPGEPAADEGDIQRIKWVGIWETIIRMGMGETILRIGTGLVSLILVFLVIWIMTNFYLTSEPITAPVKNDGVVLAAPLPTPTATVAPVLLDDIPYYGAYLDGIIRLAKLDTLLPAHPRFEVIIYEVQKGDTLFSIAQKFNLHPETLLWGNYFTLIDDPHKLRPGQQLNILPVDGVYYEWHAGDGLNKVAEFYKVKPEDIIAFPGNHLSLETVGDFMNPKIKAGTWLVVPGGKRDFISWSAPRITRKNPAVAKLFGPGACGEVVDGPIGIGVFIWPTVATYLSGFDYSPETNHYGIDIAGSLGNAVFAVDSGVVVYSGWNDWGYGNVIVIDHGNGWQSLYAHLNTINVGCGAPVTQGNVIGGLGSTGNSTGPHLHFEFRSDEYGRPNPWNFLPH